MCRPLPLALLAAATLLSACKKEEPEPAPKPQPHDTEEPDPTGETGTIPTGETGTVFTGDTAPPVPFDCATVPANVVGHTELQAARGYHGLAIDPDGYMIGSDGNNLLKVSYDNEVQIFVPNLGSVQGMDFMINGDLVVASDNYGALVRITPAGSVTPLTSNISAYGVLVAPNGDIFAADRDDVWKVDPDTGDKVRFVDGQNGMEAQSLAFSPDYTKLYMTSNFGYALWQMDIDANFEAISTPTRLADYGNSYRDGLTVDWCGNLYAPDYGSHKLYRITPTGTVTTLLTFQPFDKYGHGVIFGTGVGDWKYDSIYMPQPYDNTTVVEIDLGVPGGEWIP